MLQIKLDARDLGDLAEETGLAVKTEEDNYKEWRRDFIKVELVALIGATKVTFWASVPSKSAVKPPEFLHAR